MPGLIRLPFKEDRALRLLKCPPLPHLYAYDTGEGDRFHFSGSGAPPVNGSFPFKMFNRHVMSVCPFGWIWLASGTAL